MTRKDYQLLATFAGKALAAAYLSGGEDARTVVYDTVYRPLTAALAADNPRFDTLRFSGFTGAVETATTAKAKALSHEIRTEWMGQGDDPNYEQEGN